MKKAKKILLITVVAVLAITVGFLAIGFISLARHPEEAPASAAAVTAEVPAAAPVSDGAAFLDRVREIAPGNVSSDEKIVSVALEGRELRVVVDMSEASNLSRFNGDAGLIDSYLITRAEGLFEKVLALGEENDAFYDVFTVDFGSLGRVSNKLADVQLYEGGGVTARYIPEELQHVDH